MVRFNFNVRKDDLVQLYVELEKMVNGYEFRYGVFRGGSTFGEIIIRKEGKDELEAVFVRLKIKYELENVL